MSTRTFWLMVFSAVIFIAGVVIFFKAGDMEVTVPGTVTLPFTGASVPSGEQIANLPLMMKQLSAQLGGMLFTITGAIGLAASAICHAVETRDRNHAPPAAEDEG